MLIYLTNSSGGGQEWTAEKILDAYKKERESNLCEECMNSKVGTCLFQEAATILQVIKDQKQADLIVSLFAWGADLMASLHALIDMALEMNAKVEEMSEREGWEAEKQAKFLIDLKDDDSLMKEREKFAGWALEKKEDWEFTPCWPHETAQILENQDLSIAFLCLIGHLLFTKKQIIEVHQERARVMKAAKEYYPEEVAAFEKEEHAKWN